MNILILLVMLASGGIQVFGFDDFCYDGICYDNPSGDLAVALGGRSLAVTDYAVRSAYIIGPSLGIGLDPTVSRAYINGSALGLRSLAYRGPDAGDYMCGRLYARLLERNPCSLFVHIPQRLSYHDIFIVLGAMAMVRSCASSI